jgi:microcystin-dependent protein
MDPFVGQLLLGAFNFAPLGYALCHGQVLSIQQNTALFSLIGTNYGGNGVTTFALPDLRGRVPVGAGLGPGLSDYVMGQAEGSEVVNLSVSELPAHSHSIQGVGGGSSAQVSQVAGNSLAGTGSNLNLYAVGTSSIGANLNPSTIAPSGGSLPHENRMPTLTLNWVIALNGVFPPRN